MPLLLYKCRVCQDLRYHEEKTDLSIYGKLPDNLGIFECFGCGYLGVKDRGKAVSSRGTKLDDTPKLQIPRLDT